MGLIQEREEGIKKRIEYFVIVQTEGDTVCIYLYCIYVFIPRLLSAVTLGSLPWPSPLPVVNYFSIMTVAKHIITVVKERGVIHVSRIAPHCRNTNCRKTQRVKLFFNFGK